MAKIQKLVWIDLEMTGLDVEKHTPIEIATKITNMSLSEIIDGPNLVIHQHESTLEGLDPWVMRTHTESGLFDKVKQSSLSCEEAERQSLDFIQKHVEEGIAPLCGNSIGTDRAFLKRYMPRLESYLHYRNVDVSTIKILYHAWNKSAKAFKKDSRHRALEDIQDSIDELIYYQKYFCKCEDLDLG